MADLTPTTDAQSALDYDPFYDPVYDPSHPDYKPPVNIKPHGFSRFKPRGIDPFGNSGAKKRSTAKDAAYRESKAIALLESRGYVAHKVSCYAVTGGGMQFKRDFLGFADIIAFHPSLPTLLVQVTTANDMNSHLREMASPSLTKQHKNPRTEIERLWAAGVGVLLIGYERGADGKYLPPVERMIDAAVFAQVDSRRRT